MTPLRFKATGFFIAIVLCCAPAAFAEDFNWIMTSISKVGALDNGDGHEWTFRKSGGRLGGGRRKFRNGECHFRGRE